MVQRPTIPHFKALIVDIEISERQGGGIIRDRPPILIVKKQTFWEKRAWQILEPAMPLFSRNLNIHNQGFKMRYCGSFCDLQFII